jgi:pyruvate ferredoxin oxidoreductase alpha subunit
VVTVRSLRPFPKQQLAEVLKDAKRIIVFEKALAVGLGGFLALHVRYAIGSFDRPMHSVIGGLGGRAITRPSLRAVFERAVRDELEDTHILDLDREALDHELERQRASRLSGPAAENILRDIGAARAARTV